MSATEIIPGLFMGGQMLPFLDRTYDAVVDLRILEDMALPLNAKTMDQNGPLLVWAPLIDKDELPPEWKLNSIVQFIGWVLYSTKTVLVHCTEGHNRSGLLVGLYLVKSKTMAARDAIALIRQKRPGALSNQTFVSAIEDAF